MRVVLIMLMVMRIIITMAIRTILITTINLVMAIISTKLPQCYINKAKNYNRQRK